jgi:hypothetical protein
MVNVFGNSIIGAYTNGVSVKEIYTNGVKVWPTEEPPVPTEYYITWSPSMSSGSFSMEGVTYDFSDYPSGFWGFSGTITESAFGGTSFRQIETNAFSIESWAFHDCYSLSQVSLPVCAYIGRWAFYVCSSLTQVSLPVCSYIGSSAFHDCYSLSRAVLPVCAYIGSWAFTNCYSLSRAVLPVCSYIGSWAFDRCSLSQVSLPVCSYIGSDAFELCSHLKTIRLGYSSVVTLRGELWYNPPLSFSSILVPSSLVAAYKADSVWSQYSSIIYPINN